MYENKRGVFYVTRKKDNGIAVLFQKAAHGVGKALHLAAEQRVRALLGDAARVIRGIAGAAVADIPAGAVVDGLGHEALTLLNICNQIVREGHLSIGGKRCGAETQQQNHGQKNAYDLFFHGFHSPFLSFLEYPFGC